MSFATPVEYPVSRAKHDRHYNYRDVAVDASVAGSAEAGVVIESWLVLAHGSLRARVVPAIGLLFLAVDAGITVGALASVALGQVDAGRAVVAGLRGALVYVDLAAPTGESSGAEALDSVAHGYAESTVLANVVGALDGLAFFAADGP
jgi:hypothetical protein